MPSPINLFDAAAITIHEALSCYKQILYMQLLFKKK